MSGCSKNRVTSYFSHSRLVFVGIVLLLVDVVLYSMDTGAGIFSAVAALLFGLGAAANLLNGNPEGRAMNIVTLILAAYFFFDIVVRIFD